MVRREAGAFGYDALSSRYQDLRAIGVIDAAKVVRCALQHAASIGGLVLTTDAIVVDTDEDTETPEGESGSDS